MSEERTYSVGLIGIIEQEQLMLQNAFWLSRGRPKKYVTSSSSDSPDIYIVDGDDGRSLETWQALCQNTSSTHRKLVILATSHPQQKHDYPIIPRPLLATRVLSLLDQVVQTPLPKTLNSVVPFSGPQRALVVDQSLPVRKQMGLELQLSEVAVDFAESGEQALEFISQNNYAAIFLDVILPGIDGYQVCKSIKKDKTKQQTPVIIMTSKNSPFDRAKGKLVGCDSYLSKPVRHHTFKKIIQKYLGNPTKSAL